MNHNFYGSQFNMDDYLNSIWSRYGYSSTAQEDKKKTKKLKKELSDLAISRHLPVHIRVTPYGDWNFYRLRKFTVDITSSQLQTIEKFWFDKFLSILSMLPPNSNVVHKFWILSMIYSSKNYLNYFITNDTVAFEKVKEYFNGKCTYDEVAKLFTYPADKAGNMWGYSQGKYSGGKLVGSLVPVTDMNLYEIALKTFRKRFLKDATKVTTPSMRKGNRINRWYTSGLDYRPLANTYRVASKLKKVLIIVDSSWSMSWSIWNTSSSFISALTNSGVVDVSHVLLHSENWFEDTIDEVKKGNIFYYSGGGEGFQFLYENTPPEWIREADCVIVITDMNYDSYAEEGILEVTKKAKSSLVLSFGHKGTVGWFDVKLVKNVKDMSDAVLSIISK